MYGNDMPTNEPTVDLTTVPLAETHYLGQPVTCVVRVEGRGYVPAAMTSVRADQAFVLWSHVEGAWVYLSDVYPA